MASTDSSPLPGFKVEEALQIHLVAFNAAVTAYRPSSVVSFGPSCFGEEYIPVEVNVFSRGEMPLGGTEAEKIAYKKLNLCDTFCAIFFEPVKARLQPYQASVEYVAVRPKPIRTFVTGYENPYTLHSILLIRKKDDSTVVLDGTGEQFFWPESAAIMDGDNFWDTYTTGQGPVDDIKHYDLEDLRETGGGYWFLIGSSLRQMLNDLSWETLEKMSPHVREEYIRVESERRARAAAEATWG